MPKAAVVHQDVEDTDLSGWNAAPFLEKVTQVAPSVIYVFNQRTQCNEYTNRNFGQSLGYSSDEVRAMGSDLIEDLCHPHDLSSVVAHFGTIQSLRDGEMAQIDYRMLHKNGHWVWLTSHDTVFDRDGEGCVLRHIGVATDISAQKNAEELAVAEKLKAATVNEELRAFSYALSHDMKSPANTMQLLITELRESHGSKLDADALDLIDMAIETSERMGELVDDVISYTRVIEADPVWEDVDLGVLVPEVIEQFDAEIRDCSARIYFDEMPCVKGDAAQLRFLFHNLMQNALKFRKPDGVPMISILSAFDVAADQHVITTKDNGIGIDKSAHNDIFKVFKRLNSSRDYQGSGLGLAICRRVAANHGDQISVTSSPGQGAAFTIRLQAI